MNNNRQKKSAIAQRRYREKGRQIAVVLHDLEVIRALDRGREIHGGIKAAVEQALLLAYSDLGEPPTENGGTGRLAKDSARLGRPSHSNPRKIYGEPVAHIIADVHG